MKKYILFKGILLSLIISTHTFSEYTNNIYGYLSDINLQDNYNIRKEIQNNYKFADTQLKNSISYKLFYNNYDEVYKGVLKGNSKGNSIFLTTSKQITNDGELGFILGSGEKKIDFSANRKIKSQNIFIGGFYNYNFSKKLNLLTMGSFNHSHNSIKIENRKKTTSPTMSLSLGSHLSYLLNDSNIFGKFYLTSGFDWSKIFQGTYNDTIMNNTGKTEYYDSVRPTIGFANDYHFSINNIYGKINIHGSYEKEFGNIKNKKNVWHKGKRGQLKTLVNENITTLGINSSINLTQNLKTTLSYNRIFSKDYSSNLYGGSFEYKIDKLSIPNLDTFNLLNKEKRFRVSANTMLETENYEDNPAGTSGSTAFSPRLVLVVNDKKGPLSYQMDTFYKTEDWFGGNKDNEGKDTNRRINPQINIKPIKINDKLSVRGYIGWRNQVRKQTIKGSPYRIEVNSYRIAPGITYIINDKISFLGSTLIAMDEISDTRKNYYSNHNYWMENIYGFKFSLNKQWTLTTNFYRLDKKYIGTSNDSIRNDHCANMQFRPVLRYNFSNGSYAQLAGRFAIKGGERIKNIYGYIGSENEETRYTALLGHKFNDYFTGYTEVTMNSFKRTNEKTKEESRTSRLLFKVGAIYT
ncbi:MAG: autotransporter outer membrane beta-barrel domain-containing protein, partial [Cetobacterium sp.]|nr:autotransporter outer membrane beta-barrel domain-containing protein [Cetobacterium sp.]